MGVIHLHQPPNHHNSYSQKSAVLTEALLKAVTILHFSHKKAALMLGLSEATFSRIAHGKKFIEVDAKSGDIALIFIRIFRSLDSLFGGHEENCRRWFYAHNHHVQGVPADLVLTIGGLSDVARYLDALRGKI